MNSRRIGSCLLLASIAATYSGAVHAVHAAPARPAADPAIVASATLLIPVPMHAALQAANGDAPLPNGPGRDLAKKLCSTCHSNNVWAVQRHTPERWASIVDNMTFKGMDASDADIDTIDQYLGKYLASTPKPPPPPDPPANPPRR